ncbi:unnamed protein product [Aureobasidium vineae]|uniref:Zn(2)-C6 fungal-type domain-containing protein n=1 Tax=Aureobasidium vineae TaxID=2773715 RepID=A0A9N8P4T1_9PEZI|nr:unnamed protein product [Aureobasidium vineae]
MPYRGKPSQGCEECRKRRKKCDLRPGGCGRCANAHRQCPGYPQQEGLRILDQSAEVVAKVLGVRSKGQTPEAVDDFDISFQPESPLGSDRFSSAAHSSSAISAHVSPPPMDSEDLSLAFFFKNCVINHHVYHTCVHEPDNKHLIASIKAFGIANLSKHYSDRRLLISAQHQYATALNLTNLALRDPSQVKRDETLLAILVLTNYETLTGGVTRTLDAWEQHVNGSASLLNLRGLDGVQGTSGRVLTLHVITGINVICLLRNLPTPPFVHILQKKIFEYLYEPNNPAIRYQRINLECADFRHAVSHCLITSPEEIVSRVAELDAKLTDAFANVPPSWKADIITHFVHRESAEAGLPGFELRYADQATNYIWASYRSSRIMVNEIVLQSIANDSDAHQSARTRSQTIMRQCQTEILAGMPQYTSKNDELLPWSGFKRPVRYFVPEAASSELPIMRALSGYGVLWPLFVAGSCYIATVETKTYVTEVYRYFGEQLKIEQALVLRKMIFALLRVAPSPGPSTAADKWF